MMSRGRLTLVLLLVMFVLLTWALALGSAGPEWEPLAIKLALGALAALTAAALVTIVDIVLYRPKG